MELPEMLSHISYEHRVIFNKAHKDDGETKKVVCSVCLEPINPDHAFFSCTGCDELFVHKTCLYLPWQTEYPMHPHTPLTLLPDREGPHSLCLCHVCGRDSERFYSCEDCKFHVCIICIVESKIKHVSHEHLLIPSELEERDEEEVICYGCQKPIADDQVYSCSGCNFFLHKTCAALPTEVKCCPKHPEHPLTFCTRPPNSSQCNLCEGSFKGFTYYCKLCNFNACISCVMLGHIQHMSHWHPLFPMEPQVTNSEEVVCRGCKKQIANDNAFICRDCNFFLHKTCAELPDSTQHVSHKEHVLTLLPSPNFSSICDVCEKVWEAFTYHCDVCGRFRICVPCFVLGKIKHASHNHFMLPMEANKDDGKEAFCFGCRRPILDHGYSCKNCDFFLHKVCVELADEIQNVSHPQHPLTLEVGDTATFCACCGERWSRFTYDCKDCEFKLCLPCAWILSDQPREMENASLHPHPLSPFLRLYRSYSTYTCNCCGERSEPLLYRCERCEFYVCTSCALCALHPQITAQSRHGHPLTIMRRALFQCDACGIQVEDHAYVCITCRFWVHKSCIELESTFHSGHHNQHPLTLAFSLPTEYLKFDSQKCDICAKQVRPSLWVYHCAPCRFLAHLKCATSEVKSICRFSEIEEEEAYDSKVIRLPVRDECTNLVSYLLGTANRGQIQRAEEVTHSSHHHPLILCDKAITKDDKLVCSGCVQPILDSYYSCSQRCGGFSLHISCTELPDEVRHPSHPEHPLFLNSNGPHYFACKICGFGYRGFEYKCKHFCGFELDVKCALIGDAMLHESHQHPLSLKQSRPEECCNACGGCPPGFLYGCDSCGYYLDTVCATWPRTARHKYDPHPLILTYRPFDDHPDDFYCEKCQTEINPKPWLYHCRDCNQSFHPFCLIISP
ncbi:hypothetical protein RJ639_040262 [Escallonia herrerae]|uniref:Phorbol-ester/DAG-type domain-containing protein n=1 Tax=Escallonia herrerae TaxID=1293975 RepID=A0AA88WHC2_9ASTE|nr:hypothetical protein RJ639_040262 [Escallonia herrerae]